MGLSYAIVPYITERNKMIKDKTFRITYKKSNGETVTRFGKFDDKCRYWTSKLGNALITYFDLDRQGYRTAKGSWKVRY
jgi:hypothetical protein